MQEVSVNSTFIQVSSHRNGRDPLCWQSPIDEKNDLLDLLISRIQDPSLFQFTPQRFGDGTAAAPENHEKISAPKKYAKKVIELVPFDVSPYKGNSFMTEIVFKDGFELYRYAFFTVLYGESGDRADVRCEKGEDFEVGPNDAICRRYHVFIAYIRDSKGITAVMLTEARGRNSIADPMRWQIKNLLSRIGDKNFFVKAQEYINDDALKAFINSNQWGEVHLFKDEKTSERGDLPEYFEQVLTLKLTPQKKGVNGQIKQSICNKLFNGTPIQNIKVIDDFEPDQIKFTVKGCKTERTFTIDKPLSGGVRKVLDSGIIMPDGLSNDVDILREFKKIFEEEHLPH